jgi:excisionase family DNA binding protein
MRATASSNSLRLLLTIPEAAITLGISRSRLYELVQVGVIGSVKIGRSRRVPVTILQDFIAKQLVDQRER